MIDPTNFDLDTLGMPTAVPKSKKSIKPILIGVIVIGIVATVFYFTIKNKVDEKL